MSGLTWQYIVPFDPLTGILHTILFTVDVRGPLFDPRIPGYIDLVHNHDAAENSQQQ